MRIISLILISICSIAVAYGQPDPPVFNPLPPNTASLFSDLAKPVGSFTGTVPVRIPITKIGSGSLSTELALNYISTGGIKIEDAASCVGLGFNFEDGGSVITQTINGLPDDYAVGRLNNSTKPDNFNCEDVHGDAYNAYYSWYSIDLQPDIFLLKFKGQSIKFFINNDRKIVMMTKTGVKVEFITSTGPAVITRWIVTDEAGNKFYYGNKQQCTYTSYDTETSSTSTGISSFNWYVDSVKDMTNTRGIYFEHMLSDESVSSFSGGRKILTGYTACDYFDLGEHFVNTTADASELINSKIKTDEGFILISGNTGRQDSYGRKIDSIRIFTPDSQLVKKFIFRYGYFSTGSNMYEKRMYLKTISEFGSTGMDSLCHKFDYNTDYILPSRYSNQRDYWGYYCQRVVTSYYPNVVFNYNLQTIRTTDLGDRSPIAASTMACVLQKITYPSGGSRTFAYEGNTALRHMYKELYYPDATNSTLQTFTHYENEFSSDFSILPFFTKLFHIQSTDGGARFTYNMNVPYGCATSIKFYKVSNLEETSGGELMYEKTETTGVFDLDTGYYRMEFYRESSSCEVASVSGEWRECIISWNTTANPSFPDYPVNENNMAVGGIRVKDIEDTDPVTGHITHTSFYYKSYQGDSTKTSGLLISEPVYVAPQQVADVGCFTYALLATSNSALVNDGAYVGYTDVRTVTDRKLGWVDQKFSFNIDVANEQDVPFTPLTDNSIYRGRVLEEKSYDSSGTLLKKVNTDYDIEGTFFSQLGIAMVWYWACSPNRFGDHPCSSDEPNIAPAYTVCHTYGINGGETDVNMVIDSTFAPSGVIVEKTHFLYDTLLLGRMFLSKVKTYLSNGQVKVTTLRYPFTSNGIFLFGLTAAELTVKSALLNLNYMQPIETVDSVYNSAGAGVFVGGSKLIYTNAGSAYYLTKLRTYTTLADSTETNMSGYDSKYNVIEKYKTNDIKEAYLWGYDNNYVVAKIVGSDYNTVAALVDSNVLQHPSSDAALRTELDKIRQAFAGSSKQVITYTYKKGVGKSSITDASGKTMYYEYDPHGRLAAVRDQNNKVITKLDYNVNNP